MLVYAAAAPATAFHKLGIVCLALLCLNSVDADNVISVTCEQSGTISGPSKGDALDGDCLLACDALEVWLELINAHA